MDKYIAIQLFGHLRTFEHTAERFKQFVVGPCVQEGYKVDIFIHTWDEIDHNTVNYRNPDGMVLDDNMVDKKKVVDLYHPKKLVLDRQLDVEEQVFVEKIGNYKRSIKGCLNNAYTIYKVNELRKEYGKENDIKYDWVIQTRPDILFNTPLNIKEYEEAYSKNNLPMSENAIFFGYNLFTRGKVQDDKLICGSDIIFFAKPINMDKAVSLYKEFDANLDINDFYCFEYWWLSYWKKQNLQTIPVKYLFRHDWCVLYKSMLST